jgi:HAD superfamily hydrolase (TIGR01509 family)
MDLTARNGLAARGRAMVIFDCNGVLVDSEPIVTAVLAEQFAINGLNITPEFVARHFVGRRPSDMFALVEAATGRKLPAGFGASVTTAIVRRFRTDLTATRHMAYALTWLRGPKCVASSSTLERVRVSLDTTGLLRFFEPHLFSASEVRRGKPAPDLFLYAAGKMQVTPARCIVVEDSPAGVAAATSAGMTTIGFVGGSHAGENLARDLTAAGARTIIADMRALKRAVLELRGW